MGRRLARHSRDGREYERLRRQGALNTNCASIDIYVSFHGYQITS